MILSACSPYFHAMFTSELLEARQTEVPIRDIDEHAVDLLVNFCYTSEITIEESNVQTLLPAGQSCFICVCVSCLYLFWYLRFHEFLYCIHLMIIYNVFICIHRLVYSTLYDSFDSPQVSFIRGLEFLSYSTFSCQWNFVALFVLNYRLFSIYRSFIIIV